jgi:acyl carrier protein
MTRDEVKSVVVKHLCDAVEGLKAEGLDCSQSMKVLGANSLDMVEIVSSSMRELKVKIPRAELNKLTNVDQLIDLLFETAQKK